MAVGPNGSYILDPGGNLYRHTGTNPNAGFALLATNVAQVSAGIGARHQDVVFVLQTNGNLFEYDSNTDTSVQVGSTVGVNTSDPIVGFISASQISPDTVFEVGAGGSILAGYYGVAHSTGWLPTNYSVYTLYSSNVPGAITQIGAGLSSGNAAVFAQVSTGNVYVYTTTGLYYTGYSGTPGGTEFSASQVENNEIFIRNASGSLYRTITENGVFTTVPVPTVPNVGTVTWVSAGVDAQGLATAYYTTSQGYMYEYDLANLGTYFISVGPNTLDSDSASQVNPNLVFAYAIEPSVGKTYYYLHQIHNHSGDSTYTDQVITTFYTIP
jgi:hypothetical protein